MHQSLLMTAFIENGMNGVHLVHNMSRILYANLQSTYHSGCEKAVYQSSDGTAHFIYANRFTRLCYGRIATHCWQREGSLHLRL